MKEGVEKFSVKNIVERPKVRTLFINSQQGKQYAKKYEQHHRSRQRLVGLAMG